MPRCSARTRFCHWSGRRLPIVADEHADPEAGSGAVKITPAHDFNDFEVGRRHGLEVVNVFDESARLNENAPEAYRGLDRFEAREKIVADLEAAGLIARIEPHEHVLPYGDRSDTVIEPWLTDQWYADADALAGPAVAAVEEGRTQFVPKRWEKTFFEWMRNIQPWCISRQLWWGHQIPAWYGPDGQHLRRDDRGRGAGGGHGPLWQGGGADARPGRPRHLVLLGAVAVLDARLARAHARARALLPDRRPGDELRHHLLLGRADDDDGAEVHGRGALPHRLHPRPGARRTRPEDVQEQGQRHRPLGPGRALWRRCAALHADRHGRAGSRHQRLGEPHRGLPQLRHQALERRALLPDERMRRAGKIRPREPVRRQ